MQVVTTMKGPRREHTNEIGSHQAVKQPTHGVGE